MVTLKGHGNSVMALAFSPDGRSLATTGMDGNVILWDVRSGRIEVELHGHKGIVHTLAFSPDGRLLASAGDDGTVRIWGRGGSTVARFGSAVTEDRLGNLIRELIRANKSDAEAIDALFLTMLARFPTDTEKQVTVGHVAGKKDNDPTQRQLQGSFVQKRPRFQREKRGRVRVS